MRYRSDGALVALTATRIGRTVASLVASLVASALTVSALTVSVR
jgi:hypothetical protein